MIYSIVLALVLSLVLVLFESMISIVSGACSDYVSILILIPFVAFYVSMMEMLPNRNKTRICSRSTLQSFSIAGLFCLSGSHATMAHGAVAGMFAGLLIAFVTLFCSVCKPVHDSVYYLLVFFVLVTTPRFWLWCYRRWASRNGSDRY